MNARDTIVALNSCIAHPGLRRVPTGETVSAYFNPGELLPGFIHRSIIRRFGGDIWRTDIPLINLGVPKLARAFHFSRGIGGGSCRCIESNTTWTLSGVVTRLYTSIHARLRDWIAAILNWSWYWDSGLVISRFDPRCPVSLRVHVKAVEHRSTNTWIRPLTHCGDVRTDQTRRRVDLLTSLSSTCYPFRCPSTRPFQKLYRPSTIASEPIPSCVLFLSANIRIASRLKRNSFKLTKASLYSKC